MNNIEVTFKKKRYCFSTPSEWNELSREQILLVCKLLSLSLPEDEFRLRAAMVMLPKKVRRLILRRERYLSTLARLFKKSAAGEELTDLLLEAINLADSFKFLQEFGNRTTNPLPEFRLMLRKYVGPADSLRNCSYVEYATTEQKLRLWDSYATAGDHERASVALLEAIAVFWRPEKRFIRIRKLLNTYNGDPRQAFNEASIAQRAQQLKKLPAEKLEAAMLFIDASYRHIVEEFSEIFSTKGETDGFGHAGLLLDLAGDKFGPLKETANTNLYTLLLCCLKAVKDAEKLNQPTTANDIPVC